MEAGTPELVKLEDLQVGSGLTGRKHIISLLVENKPGVLARIAGLFSRRGFNIQTLAVGPTDDPTLSRLTLFKVSADGESRGQIMQFTDIFRGKVIDVSKRSVTVEITGTDDKIEAFERMIRPFGLIEMVRTGEIAISRGRSTT